MQIFKEKTIKRKNYFKIFKNLFKFFVVLAKITKFFVKKYEMENILDKLQREEILIASPKKRAFAFVIDDVVVSVLFFAIYFDAFTSVSDDIVALNAKIASFAWQLIALRVLYQTFFVWRYGATLGKIALKIRCLDEDLLDTPNLAKSFLRACIRVVSETCFYLGFAWAFGNAQRQTWHDRLARTIVCETK